MSRQVSPRRPGEKLSVAVAIHAERGDPEPELLVVLRPSDDAELPNVWGLPAVSLIEEESWEEAVRRLGRQKLGVTLEPVSEMGEGEVARSGYVLWMKLYEALILEGEPMVPQPGPGVTQYVECRWSGAEQLVDGARSGSLCCQLYLRDRGLGWS